MPPFFLAFIPARSGSKGVKHKNIRDLGGHPLLAWSIAAARLTPGMGRVIVSTDSPEYGAAAKQYGAEVPFLRPAELAADTSLDIDCLRHLLDWLRERGEWLPDYILHLRPTCPLRDPAVMRAAMDKILSAPDATSICSAHAVEYPPCKYLRLNPDGTFSGYMGEEYVNLPRQSCPQAYRGNGHADIYKTENIFAGDIYGPRRLAFIAPDPGDVDSEEDFSLLAERLRREGSPLKRYFTSLPHVPDRPAATEAAGVSLLPESRGVQ